MGLSRYAQRFQLVVITCSYIGLPEIPLLRGHKNGTMK